MKIFRDINKDSPLIRAKIIRMSNDMHLFYSKSLDERQKILNSIKDINENNLN